MEPICQLVEEYHGCEGKVIEYDLKKWVMYDFKVRNYKMNLCEYHFRLKSYPESKRDIYKILKKKC